jgi:hypothetical protein
MALLQFPLELNGAEISGLGELIAGRFGSIPALKFGFESFDLHQLLDLTAQGDFLLVCEQGHPSNIPEVRTHQIDVNTDGTGGGCWF